MKYTRGVSCGRGHHDYKVTKSGSVHYVAVCRKCGSSKTVYRLKSKKQLERFRRTGSVY
jgi:hypothetical protein